MAIKKYFANADNTITNAFRSSLQTRGTDANMGASDILEVFSIYGQESSASSELTRILINFPISEIIEDRLNGVIPTSGEVTFKLNLYNAKHTQTVPRHIYLNVYAVSRSWQEGTGLDMEEYRDVVAPGDIGSTWMTASSTAAWTTPGGDYHSSPKYSEYFDKGTEDLSVDVTSLVEEWVAGTKDKYGFGIQLTSSQEESHASHYTKMFFGRGTEFFFSRPTLEAVWNDSIYDDRGNFHAESNLLPDSINKQTLFLYNEIGGKLYDIPATGSTGIKMRLFDASSGGSPIVTDPSPLTATRRSQGIYSTSFSVDTTASVLYDRWYNSDFTTCFHTGTLNIKQHSVDNHNPYPSYVTTLTNLRPIYYPHETARFRFYIRDKDWSPTLYTVSTKLNDTLVMPTASYQIYRVIDDQEIVSIDTGSLRSTNMSYDVSGNYFDFHMVNLEPGYSYGIKVSYYSESVKSYVEQPYVWSFRVEELNER